MNKIFYVLITSFLLVSSCWAKGSLLLIGGGPRTEDILQKMIELSSGKILIIPLASEIPDEVGMSAKQQLEAHGAKSVSIFSCKDLSISDPNCLKEISETRLIYFTGGSQGKLLKAFKGSEALRLIRERYEHDLSLAGTSAGTAIMSEVMITGNALPPYTNFQSVRAGLVETTTGFGFVKKIIIDQHFIKRSRQNRLMSAVLERPDRIGVGIDESTAILVHADESFEVLGEGQVMVFDARQSTIANGPSGLLSSKNLLIQLLIRGDKFKF